MTDKITIERETLLPCPFCGSGAAITGTEWGGREQFFVACTGPDCRCAVGENYDRDACPEYSFSSKDDALSAWNLRAALAAQPAPDLPEDVEAVIACLGDDAAMLRDKNPDCEIAANMEEAARLLAAQPADYAIGYAEGFRDACKPALRIHI